MADPHETDQTAGDLSAHDAPAKKKRRRRGGRGRRKPASEGNDENQTENGAENGADNGAGSTARQAKSGGRGRDAAARAAAKATADTDNKEVFSQEGFDELGLRNSVLKSIQASGFVKPTHIQAELIPRVLAGKDVLGQAKTGSGKTAAFGLPLFHMATRNLPYQSLVLCPTRELAIQIAGELADLGRFTPIHVTAVYGGQRIASQETALAKGPEIIVATPGRLQDLVERGVMHLDNIKFAVLDEVDRMLDIGFRDDIRRILKMMPAQRQTVFVSATISDEIEKLARTFMHDAEKVETVAGSLTVNQVQQHYLSAKPWAKRRLLKHLLTHEEPELTVVFCRTKRMVDKLSEYLSDKGIKACGIHGDLPQSKRNRVMEDFRAGKIMVLVASDLAARGLDVDGITHVVNYDLPEDPEVYIHRIGRTARAGRDGVAWSLVTPDQGDLLTAIENLANIEIAELSYDDFDPGEEPEMHRRRREEREGPPVGDAPPAKSRYEQADLPTKAKENSTLFPGGVAPTAMPPKLIRGRVRTTRSNKALIQEASNNKPS